MSERSYESVTADIGDIALRGPDSRLLVVGLLLSFLLFMLLITAASYLILRGVGIWGINIPVAWGFAITNFVWWIGIGHAGTFISAILYLFHQEWRTAINRFAEAMTLFAVCCAGLMPLLHLGRPWYFYWILPYPDTMMLWPQFRSPLVWDCFAVGTYFTVSLIFWYIGLIPDVASMRDRARGKYQKLFYGLLSLGWRNDARHWYRYQTLYLLLAALATPLVISVHSVVSLDFTAAQLAGWHSTFFPPYFVAGAIFSGFAMVITLGIPMRRMFRLEKLITIDHLEKCAKLLLVTGLIVDYAYLIEGFQAWYTGDVYDSFVQANRAWGPYWPAFWTLISCNVFVPQLIWFKKIRTSVSWLFVISILVNVGMWTERYVIIITSLHRDFLPSSWGIFHGTVWDWAILAGSVGLFMMLFLLFMRFFPTISIAEERREIAMERGAPEP